MNTARAAATRLPAVDLARGLAVAMMFAYHFCFDLANFGFLQQDLYDDWRWNVWRALILGSFLLLVGVSLSLARCAGWRWSAFARRWWQIAACAALVSLGSYLMFPRSWIYFGVLHHMAIASLLALPLLGRPQLALLAGLLLLALGTLLRHPFFDVLPWQIVGLMTHKPRTEDYVPLLPWSGLVCIGLWAGARLTAQPAHHVLRTWQPQGRLTRTLTFAGRHSLLLYMVHQPVFIGLLQAWAARR